ncbi:MAG: threonine synthase [Spirochaetaceae bacterium]|jgi:threonine synthase|nr:threonine synthase [Spirochaetaceae bacterium]
MLFKSTNSDTSPVSFKEAVLRCLPDGGLYVPASLLDLRQFFVYMNSGATYPELVSAIAPLLLQGEMNPYSASRVAESAFNFEPELVPLDDHYSLLTLYNGPTGVFKDFGVAFLAAVLEELLKHSAGAMVISAGRGDTGVSIASAFARRRGITNVILYPPGPIRGLKPADFVPNGGNVIPIQVRGTFDDCQNLVKAVINDRPFAERYGVTCANAINIGRLLPQALYYLYAFIKVKKQIQGDLIFSVPSGNFGNLIAGLYAWKFGMPVNGFIAAMNGNEPFGSWLRGGRFVPRPAVSTKSPALDISSPANFERLAAFYQESPVVMRNMVYPAAVDDRATLAAMEKVWRQYQVIIDPHAAVAFAAAEQLSENFDPSSHVVVLATGHPAKESQTVLEATGQHIKMPHGLALLHEPADPIAIIKPDLTALEGAIASCL